MARGGAAPHPGFSWRWKQDADSIEVKVPVPEAAERADVSVKTSAKTIMVQAKAADGVWHTVLSGSFFEAVDDASCCWALEKLPKNGGKAVVIQLEKRSPLVWDALLDVNNVPERFLSQPTTADVGVSSTVVAGASSTADVGAPSPVDAAASSTADAGASSTADAGASSAVDASASSAVDAAASSTADGPTLPPAVYFTQDEESIEISVAIPEAAERADVCVKTTAKTIAVQAKAADGVWHTVLSGSLFKAVDDASCCWTLEKPKNSGKVVVIQLEKRSPLVWDALLDGRDAEGSFLEKLGREEVKDLKEEVVKEEEEEVKEPKGEETKGFEREQEIADAGASSPPDAGASSTPDAGPSTQADAETASGAGASSTADTKPVPMATPCTDPLRMPLPYRSFEDAEWWSAPSPADAGASSTADPGASTTADAGAPTKAATSASTPRIVPQNMSSHWNDVRRSAAEIQGVQWDCIGPADRSQSHADRAEIDPFFRDWLQAVRAIAAAEDRARQSEDAHVDDWSAAWPAAPTTAAEALDPHGPWSASACGVEIRACRDKSKGKGVFATRKIPAHALVGVYWGEQLTQRQLDVRHGVEGQPHSATDLAELTPLEKVLRRCRRERLRSAADPPMKGEANGGTYFFKLVARRLVARTLEVVGIDGEDPALSSWCRYINSDSPYRANVASKMDGRRSLVWVEATREIARGEEVCFVYTGMPAMEYTWRFGMPVTRAVVKFALAVLGWLVLALVCALRPEIGGAVVVYVATPAAACYLLWIRTR